MPQVIYTGENYQKPIQSGGRALQALSQFTQQRQQRKEADKERSRKDRDALAKMMEIDPVYASHTALQTQMATELDSLKDVLIDMNKEMAGREPTTADYMRMQQEKARGMAKLNQLKALDTEVQQSANAVKMNPTKYDPVLYQEAMDEFMETSKRPDQGFLFPMIHNPENLYTDFKNAQIKGAGGRQPVQGEFVSSPDGGGYYPQSYVYGGRDKYSEEDIQSSFLQSPASYDVQGWFDTRVPEVEQEQYLKRTGGDRAAAAELRLRERTAGTTYPPIPEEMSKKWVKPSISETSPARQGIRILDGSIYDGDTRMSSIQSNVPVEGGSVVDKAVVFDYAEARKHSTPIPKETFILPDGVEFSSPSVSAIVHAADKDKTYWIVDRRSLDKVSFTESAMEAYGQGNFTEADEDGRWKIKEGFESDVVLPTRTDDAMGLVDNWTNDLFRKQVASLPDSKEEEKIEW